MKTKLPERNKRRRSSGGGIISCLFAPQ